jgi:hypothetical protein
MPAAFCLPRSLASCCGGYPARSLVVALGLGRSIFVPSKGQPSCKDEARNSALGRMPAVGQQRQTNPSAGMSARPQKAAVSKWVAHWRSGREPNIAVPFTQRGHAQPSCLKAESEFQILVICAILSSLNCMTYT